MEVTLAVERRRSHKCPYRLAMPATSPASAGEVKIPWMKSLPRAARGRGTMRSMVEGASWTAQVK